MKILCSACLLGENCKYNGGNNYSETLMRYIKYLRKEVGVEVNVIPVCPEVLGGLPIPRVPAEIVKGEVRTQAGISVNKEFRRGADKALSIALAENVDVAILQSRSPSCGVKEVYDGTFSGARIAGSGIFASLLKEHGIEVIDVGDLST